MKHLIFLVGSSAVGKTTLLNQCLDSRVTKVPLSARTTRAKLNNPSWKDLMASVDLVANQQRHMIQDFADQILAAVNNANDDADTLLFERNMVDVLGYSSAFKVPLDEITKQMWVAQRVYQGLKNDGHHITHLYLPISKIVPYDLIDARPPESIRNRCNKYLEAACEPKRWRDIVGPGIASPRNLGPQIGIRITYLNGLIRDRREKLRQQELV